jgi:hypothetical protein
MGYFICAVRPTTWGETWKGGEQTVWTMDRVDLLRLARAVLTAPFVRRKDTFHPRRSLCAMKALFLLILALAARSAVHNDNLRANQFDETKGFSPYLAMLPRV